MKQSLTAVLLVALVLGSTPTAQAADEVQAILDKAIAAHGGAEKLGKFPATTYKGKGTAHVGGMDHPYTSDYAAQGLERFRAKVAGDGFEFVTLVKGDKAWRSLNGTTEELSGADLADARNQAHAQWVGRLVTLKDKAYKLEPVGEVTVEGKPAVGVKASRAGFADINLYFDKASGLLVKTQMRVNDTFAGKERDQEAFYAGYEDTVGGKRPTKIVVKRDGEAYVEAEMHDFYHHEKLDDSVFEIK